jgi:molybdate transport system permease protein
MIDWTPLLLSLRVATLATLLATALGVAIATVLAVVKPRGRELIDALVTAPMVLPPTVLGYYVLGALGRHSYVGQLFERATGAPIVFTATGAVIAAAIGALPLITKSARAALEEVDPRLVGAARSLGAGALRAFFTVSLPLARGGVAAGVTLGFARALGDFGVTLMVAGSIPGVTRTASLAIYDLVQAGREGEALGTALLLSALAIAALYGVNRSSRGRVRV